MQSSVFKQQVAQLTNELSKCFALCEQIRTTRKLGSTHNNLDRLQEALQSSATCIPVEYNNRRVLVGSRLDAGDSTASSEMNSHILAVESTIKPRLYEIANPSRQRDRDLPGFGELLRRWNMINHAVIQTLESLSRRVAATKSEPAPTPKPRRTDKVTVSVKQFDLMVEHMKNSWEERIVGSRVEYINLFDNSRKVTEFPANAFVRPVPRPARPVRTGSYERTSKIPGRNPSWDANGW